MIVIQKTPDLKLTRREMLQRSAELFAIAGLAAGSVKSGFGQTSSTTVVATPQETEGPYWVDEQLNRADLTVDPTDNSIQPGFPLILGVTVSTLSNGVATPFSGAYVDIWHCNALGIYSDEAAYNPGGGTGTVVTTGKKFLRGYQVTDAHGSVRFLTIYPGWYTSRTIHIHCRVRLYSGTTNTTNFTTQLFFDENITSQVLAMSPYSTRPGRDTYNTSDSVYSATDCVTSATAGSETQLRLSQNTSRAVGSFNVILDLNSTSTCVAGNPTGGTTPPGGGTPPTGTPPGGSTPPGGGTPPTGTPPGGPPSSSVF